MQIFYNELSLDGERSGGYHETSAPNADANPIDPFVKRKQSGYLFHLLIYYKILTQN
jgi:hypothetical protein